jgi:sigma-B regulation protein RsbU (phosphoserine phosphatase)
MTTIAEKKILLLVEDDPENIQIVHNILGEEYRIRVAVDGFKALELAKVKPSPDLILLDVIMPHRDGYEVCKHLKADPGTRDIPVIFLTGKTGVADETRGFEVGAVDYIHKPFSPPIVTARVRTHLMLRETHEALAKQLLAVSKELELARQVQLSILPQEIPKIQGLEIAARYLPMSSVGGDFYDFIVVDEKHIGVLICDVAGHGLSAALIASMVQTTLAAQFAHASDPVQVLSRLNRALHGKFESHHVTAAYVFLDMENCTVNYAGAGHPPLLLWRARNSEATECLENGLVLGPFSDPTYSAVSFSIEKGDRILLVTDGILEAVDPSGNEFGTDRLRQVLESKHALSAGRFADALLYGLSAWSEHAIGSHQADDITVLTVAVNGY